MHTTNLIPGLIIIRKPTSVSREELETMTRQVAQLTTACVRKNIEVVDIAISNGTSKDAGKQTKTLLDNKQIEVILLYSAKHVDDYERFTADMRDWYGLKVVCLR